MQHLRTAFTDTDIISYKTGLACSDLSRTKQSEKDNCDINNIISRYNATGLMPVSPLPPTYGDFTGIDDYQTALHVLMDAQDAFFNLPADIRKKFDNDPEQFVEFVTDPKNLESVVDMGLAVKRPLPVDSGEAANGFPASSDGKPSPGETPAG